ncbi:hypothetical protein SYNTR_0269 [Candidatus Syntrophocurvum alkaliphilum]|uniref:Uncharacterized protein n=1 Tax=Candidatus Syntrophocurvum alkaliphilum TaxID=2293317 RepID=A0A6I6DDH6_9FIRM|nr:hypothetical protein [Candidatus Syntrophocurvum alkaliphilum]QGT98862.1 hypothetical protein SYNTR_0269 [Candidatus Syntrophocurvum alkaliphilum]
MEENQVKTDDGLDIGTFHFLKTGWWIFHVIIIALTFYLGYLYGGAIFG